MQIESVNRRRVDSNLNYLHLRIALDGDRVATAYVRQTGSYVLTMFELVAVNDELTGEAIRLTDEEKVELRQALEQHLEVAAT